MQNPYHKRQNNQGGGKLSPDGVEQGNQAFVPALGNSGGLAGCRVVQIEDAPAAGLPKGGGAGEAVGLRIGDAAAFPVGEDEFAVFVPKGDTVVVGISFAAPALRQVLDFGQAGGLPAWNGCIRQCAGKAAHLAVGGFVELCRERGSGKRRWPAGRRRCGDHLR
ncbi:hypothetical protein BG910_05935 [Neisseria chenwenguii]|uniref:Uncharacterized protein n=1 Tax=Neisseria chenwenguii TaxID=1853278 RepID=A0A220S1I2_9NEIS|nr:hypothetical protein BG910_05935 [Neisseria chenwenguii]